jgi:hypothetical protein
MKKNLRTTLLVLLGMVVAVIALPTGFESLFLKSALDQQVRTLDARAKGIRSDVTVGYESVEVSGFLWTKYIHISRPRIEWKEGDYTQVMVLPDIKAYPRSISFKNWEIKLEGDAKIFSSLRLISTITFDPPASSEIHLASLTSKEMDMHLTLPQKISILPYLGEAYRANVTFSESPRLSLKTDTQGVAQYIKLDIKNLLAQGPDPKDSYALASASIITEKKPDSTAPVQNIDAVIKGFEVPEYIHPYGPAFVIVRATLLGNINVINDLPLQLMTQKASLDLKEASLNFSDFGINAKGTAETVLANMPVVDAQLVLRNAMLILNEASRQFSYDDRQKKFLTILMSKIAKTPADQIQDLVIPISRAGDAELFIGEIPLSKLIRASVAFDAKELE